MMIKIVWLLPPEKLNVKNMAYMLLHDLTIFFVTSLLWQ